MAVYSKYTHGLNYPDGTGRVKVPRCPEGSLEALSGLVIHSTAGFVDPGWKGHLTLELSNLARLPITLYYGMKIGQISYAQLSSAADRPYGSPGLGSKYQGQLRPTASKMYEDFKEAYINQKKEYR